MASVLDIDDFEEGRYTIPANPEQEDGLQSYIDSVEDKYLVELLGVELYGLFKAEVDANNGVPTSPRFVKIFDPFTEQINGGQFGANLILQSQGMKDMLKGIVYFLYVRDQVTVVTTVGVKETKGENSVNVSSIKQQVNSRYNQSVCTYQAIQHYMCAIDPDNYPEFAGVKLGYNHHF